MNILLIEDCEEKILSIKECLSYEIGNQIHVDVAKCLKDATRNILSKIYDLIIFDIYMPVTLDDGGQIIDISSDIIQEYTHSANYQCESIVITKYELSDIDCVGLFNENGVSIVHYSNEEDKWKKISFFPACSNKHQFSCALCPITQL